MTFQLIAPAFAEGSRIPLRYTRLDENICPALKWTGVPVSCRSFALMMEDPDAVRGLFRHFGVANIPSNWTELPESADTAPSPGPRFYVNDFGNARYDGPEPPAGTGPHRYIFRLAALNIDHLTLPAACGVATMWREVEKHDIAHATLCGTFER